MNEPLVILSKVKFQRIILVTLVTLVYGVSLKNGFVFDDRVYFIGKHAYKSFDLVAIFTSLANGVEYLPLRDITYALDHLVWGENPFGFHLTNLLFFTVNILLVRSMAEMITTKLSLISGQAVSSLIPFAVAAGFALHPINAEVANFITCRNVLVSGTLFFLSVICIIRHLDSEGHTAYPWYLIALLAFIGAMLGKATAIMLPMLLLATLPIIFPSRLKRIILSLMPFFAVSVIFFLIFKRIADEAGFTDVKVFELNLFSLERKIALALQIPFFYLKKLLVPHGYSVEYETVFGERLLSTHALLAFAALTVIVVLAIRLRRKFPELAVGACWYLAALIPVLNFFGTHPVVADRYAYLSTFGIMFLAASLLDRLSNIRFKFLVAVSICLGLAGVSIVRSLDWRTNETLWSANIRSFPNNAKSYVSLANYYYLNGEHQRALDLLSNNTKVPDLTIYYYFYKGQDLFDQNRLVEAKEKFQYTVETIGNSFIGSLYYLGLIAEREGDFMSAAFYYNKALTSQEDDIFFFLPRVRSHMKDFRIGWLDKYLSSLWKGVALNQDDLSTRRDLALTLDRLGFYKDALGQYLALEQRGVKGWQIYQNIANCYFNMNRSSDAVSYYSKVIALGGGSEDTYVNLGISYRQLSDFGQSIRALAQGVRLFPTASFLSYNLAVTYYAAGMKEQALSKFNAVKKEFPDLKDKVDPFLKKLSSYP